MTRGEVRWYTFARPDKRRPVLILTRDSVIPYLSEVTVAPVTTRVRNIPSEVVLGRSDGMPRDCAVNLDHLQTIPKSKMGPLITTLSDRKLRSVMPALQFALGFPINTSNEP